MIRYCSFGQISKINQYIHADTLEHRKNWVLVFWNVSVNILLEIRNASLNLHQTWQVCALSQEETFQSLRSENVAPSFDDVTIVFWRKSSKSLYFTRFHGKLVEQDQLFHQQTWNWNVWQVWSCSWGL